MTGQCAKKNNNNFWIWSPNQFANAPVTLTPCIKIECGCDFLRCVHGKITKMRNSGVPYGLNHGQELK